MTEKEKKEYIYKRAMFNLWCRFIFGILLVIAGIVWTILCYTVFKDNTGSDIIAIFPIMFIIIGTLMSVVGYIFIKK